MLHDLKYLNMILRTFIAFNFSHETDTCRQSDLTVSCSSAGESAISRFISAVIDADGKLFGLIEYLSNCNSFRYYFYQHLTGQNISDIHTRTPLKKYKKTKYSCI